MKHRPLKLYPESALLPALAGHEKVKVHGLGVPEPFIKKLPFPIAAPLKIFQQLGQLLSALLYANEPAEWLIVQVCGWPLKLYYLIADLLSEPALHPNPDRRMARLFPPQ